MHEWSELSRGRALALVSARDPREFAVGVFQRDSVPPPHIGPGTFTWFTDDAEAADFIADIVPVLLLDPDSWPDFDALVATTRRITRAVPDEGTNRLVALRGLADPWGERADFVWWGEFTEIEAGSTDFGSFIRTQYANHRELPDDREAVDADDLITFLRAYAF